MEIIYYTWLWCHRSLTQQSLSTLVTYDSRIGVFWRFSETLFASCRKSPTTMSSQAAFRAWSATAALLSNRPFPQTPLPHTAPTNSLRYEVAGHLWKKKAKEKKKEKSNDILLKSIETWQLCRFSQHFTPPCILSPSTINFTLTCWYPNPPSPAPRSLTLEFLGVAAGWLLLWGGVWGDSDRSGVAVGGWGVVVGGCQSLSRLVEPPLAQAKQGWQRDPAKRVLSIQQGVKQIVQTTIQWTCCLTADPHQERHSFWKWTQECPNKGLDVLSSLFGVRIQI